MKHSAHTLCQLGLEELHASSEHNDFSIVVSPSSVIRSVFPIGQTLKGALRRAISNSSFLSSTEVRSSQLWYF